MANNQLTEKLDQVSISELGFEFDEAAVWSKLEQRLDNRRALVYWWTVAACVLLATLFLPISLLKKTEIVTDTISQTIDSPGQENPVVINKQVEVEDLNKAKKPVWKLDKKGIEPIQLAQVEIKSLTLEPIVLVSIEDNKPAFAAEDISIIQASLERSSIEKGKSITVRAQLQSFPDQVKSNQKVLKIKLYEKH